MGGSVIGRTSPRGFWAGTTVAWLWSPWHAGYEAALGPQTWCVQRNGLSSELIMWALMS